MTNPELNFLTILESIIRQRIESAPETSYTAALVSAGNKRLAQKVGEEGVEVAIAVIGGDRKELLDESSDLMYHLLVLLAANDLSLAEVASQLQIRHESESNR